MGAGRPAIPFNQEVADEICDRLTCSDLAIWEVLEQMGNPISEWMFYKWQREVPEFAKDSARARESQGHHLADKALVESRTARLGKVLKTTTSGEDEPETVETIADNVERSKLVVQAYFKRAGQLNKALGDKLEHSGPGEGGAIPIICTIPRPPKGE